MYPGYPALTYQTALCWVDNGGLFVTIMGKLPFELSLMFGRSRSTLCVIQIESGIVLNLYGTDLCLAQFFSFIRIK